MYNGFEQKSLNSFDPPDLYFEKYIKMYEENPKSTVFAPLAECYRKMGRKDKALSILREGIKIHPDYLLGYLGLAQCYFDLEQFNLAYNTLKPLIEKNRENIRLQRLYSKVCEKTEHDLEALEAYKYLLFLNPKDSDAAFNVRRLEDPLLKKLKEIPPVLPTNNFLKEDEEENKWETISFQKFEILDKLAHFSQKKGDNEKATEFIELSLNINPRDVWAKERKRTLGMDDTISKSPSKSDGKNSAEVKHKLLNFLTKIKERSFQIRSQI